MRYGMVIDLRRCVGCNACTMACKVSNGTPAGVFYGHVDVQNEGVYPDAQTYYWPVLCNHCADAPCVNACPTGASKKGDDGIVSIDHDECIGCQACIAACPYGARTFIDEVRGYFGEQGLTVQEEALYAGFEGAKVYKCDFCQGKGYTVSDLGPACVQACPGAARVFGDLDDPESPAAQLAESGAAVVLGEELGTGPSVCYIPR